MTELPKAIVNVVEDFADLPGIGYRSAERLVISILQNRNNIDKKLSCSLGKLKEEIGECSQCHFFCELKEKNIICNICKDESRDNIICIVKDSLDVVAIEKTHQYNGLYHVLHGLISPLKKKGPEDIKTHSLTKRLRESSFHEIILATGASMESEGTNLFLVKIFQQESVDIPITRLSQGIPSGGSIDYLDSGTIEKAFLDRRSI